MERASSKKRKRLLHVN